jgi:ATP/maltotriose-dependent transcriptional regulator MalT
MLRAVLAHYELRRGLDRERGSALAKEALASGRLSQLSSHALYFALDALRATGEFDAALAAYESALASARQRGDLLNVGGLLAFRGWLLIDKGDLRSAEQDIREGLEFSLQHAAPGQAIYPASFLCDLLLEQGAPDEAARALAEVELPDEIPEQFPFAAFLEVRGKLGLAQREPERALADFEALRRITERLEIANPAEWPWRSRAAMALHALGRDDEARRLAREELEHARRWGLDRALGLALRTLGLVEEGEEGERRLREAVDVLAPSPARLEYAKALIDLGAAMRRRKERVAARALLRQGVDVAHKCAAFALAERGNEELATTGARPRKLLLTGLDSLTASERRVAQLAAEDLSNKEIAQTLFVTVKTIEVHLSNVYRKLDISSRRQLPEALGGTAPVAVA